jgi:type IV pilus assembly protein PilF
MAISRFLLIFLCVVSSAFLSSCATTDDGAAMQTIQTAEPQGEPGKPRKAESLIKMGDAHLREGQYRSAMKNYKEAEQLTPKDPELKFRIGLVYADYYDMLDEAEQYYREAIALKDNYSEAYNNLGTVFMRKQRYDEAIEMFKKAIDNLYYQTPEYAYFNMARAYEAKGQAQKAIEYYQMAIELRPQYYEPYAWLGLLYQREGQYVKALRTFQKVEGVLEDVKPQKGKSSRQEWEAYQSTLAGVYYHQGELLIKLGRSTEARQVLQKALELATGRELQEQIRNTLRSLSPV